LLTIGKARSVGSVDELSTLNIATSSTGKPHLEREEVGCQRGVEQAVQETQPGRIYHLVHAGWENSQHSDKPTDVEQRLFTEDALPLDEGVGCTPKGGHVVLKKASLHRSKPEQHLQYSHSS
jgi:hypothetical protein